MPDDHAARPPLVIVGASVRALAASARRAGWSVHAADLFADTDLAAVAAAAVRVPTRPDLRWPLGLPACLRGFPSAPWLYSGALENHPDLVERLARDRPLAGNDAARLRAVRDPARVARAAEAAGLAFPETRSDPAGVPADGSFLVKPRHGAGGRGIARWHGGPPPRGDRLWQRRVVGSSWSAGYLVDGRAGRLVSAGRQLLGRRWCGARGFTWCGAVDVPLDALEAPLRARLERLGPVLGGGFGLVGLVGVDFILDRAGLPHVLEVNPRPTASMELAERATGRSTVALHLAACGVASPAAAEAAAPAARPGTWAKAVLFAEAALVVDAATAAALGDLARGWSAPDGDWPALADVPAAGTRVAAGRPVVTVFAVADGAAVLRVLRRRAAAVRAVLRAARVSPPGAAGRPPRRPPGRTA